MNKSLVSLGLMQKFLFLTFSSLCAACVFWRIADWPIYFFCDEAVFAQEALSWIRNFETEKKLPMYYEIAPGRYIPMLFSYLLAPSSWILGLTPEIARTFSAFYSLLAVYWLSTAAKEFFAPKVWFLTPLLFLITPTWFLHARTAFDTPIALAFLSASLYYYLKYRLRDPRYIFALVPCICAYFYIYASSQVIAPLLAIFLLIFDAKYHWQNRTVVLIAAGFAAVLLVPAIHFFLGPVSAFSGQVQALDSFLLKSLTLQEKASVFLKQYGQAFSLEFWFSAEIPELIRHRIKGYGYAAVSMSLFILLGLGICITRIKNRACLCILVLLIIIPVPGALVGQSATRILALVIPIIALSLLAIQFLTEKIKLARILPTILALIFSYQGIAMAKDSILNGALWYNNYSLYGLQYGTRHLFEFNLPKLLKVFPNSRIFITSGFANNPDALIRFFSTNNGWKRVSIGSVELHKKQDLQSSDIFIVQQSDIEKIQESQLFEAPTIIETIPYPDGSTGFIVISLKYKANIDNILAKQKALRQRLESENINISGLAATINYSRLDMGEIANIFDKDLSTLARGLESNPFTLKINFTNDTEISAIEIFLGNTNAYVAAVFKCDLGQLYEVEGYKAPQELSLKLNLNTTPKACSQLTLSIKNIDAGEPEHIHIYELAIIN
jgi:hypothetical protein